MQLTFILDRRAPKTGLTDRILASLGECAHNAAMPSENGTRAFTLIAHRGFSSDAPENTYDAFDLAIEYGFNNIETDVQLTSDGVPVLIHDDTLDRTTTGAGPVAGASLAYINSLDAGIWFEGPAATVGRKGPAAYGDSFVPTLEEFLQRYEGNVNLHLELKSKEPELAEKVAVLIAEYGWSKPDSPEDHGVSISSFHFEQLERSRKVMTQLDHGYLLRQITAEVCEQAKSVDCTGIYPNAETVTAEDVSLAQEHGLWVRTWGVKTEDDLLRAHSAGAAGTTVDWPLRAQKLLHT